MADLTPAVSPTMNTEDTATPFVAVPTSTYNFAELAEIYNHTRVDYIVPMPMNARRMEAYVRSYDVDLDASAVVLDRAGVMLGLGMLGVRNDRAWITRLGVVPERRGKNLGIFLMEHLLNGARERNARLVQLEVIKGNIPAHRLFRKLGFNETRELLVVRRPPGKPVIPQPVPDVQVTPLNRDEILKCLEERGEAASWLDENRSLVHLDGLKGLCVQFPSGESGWVAYESSLIQMAYVTVHTPPHVRDTMTLALLYHLHDLHPMLDTKVENLPALDLRWPIFQQMGYMETFRRVEMFLYY
ncbi:MAG: GNAT family N-acetyltransferase [Anaerolineae bacterium]|nr:GNAT family N-acetyltransferase [Anaerolineae bacterium]